MFVSNCIDPFQVFFIIFSTKISDKKPYFFIWYFCGKNYKKTWNKNESVSVMQSSSEDPPMVGVISSIHNFDIQSLANSRIPKPNPYGLSKTLLFAVRKMIIKFGLITCKLLQVPKSNSCWTSFSLWQKTA